MFRSFIVKECEFAVSNVEILTLDFLVYRSERGERSGSFKMRNDCFYSSLDLFSAPLMAGPLFSVKELLSQRTMRGF